MGPADAATSDRIAHLVRRAWPVIARVHVQREDGRLVALLELDPLMVEVRAEQQGLSDGSVEAALADPRVRGAAADAVALVNAALADDAKIQDFRLVPAVP